MATDARLTPDAVKALLRECLHGDSGTADDALIVEGIVRRYGFSPTKVAENKAAIAMLLTELPDEFWGTKGGGWSFLNACNDRHGRQWTGEHIVMEALFCLGIASDQARWILDREMWSSFPGGVPYVVINPVTDIAP